MKQTCILLLLLPLFAFQKGPGPHRLALIVAVGKYPQPGKWKNLSSLNDLNYVKAALQKQGFRANTIDTLKNEQATKKNILAALDRLAARAVPGDIIYFHFSGHGQQIEDDNGDEADGYDEALIPYDAKGSYDPVAYRGENHLRDDELGKKLQAIRQKIGKDGSLLVVLDACHSGTATRGTEFSICRGEPIPFKSPDYRVKSALQLGQANPPGDGFADGSSAALGNMITISASSPNQVNYEMKDRQEAGVGSLSYSFAQSLNNLPPDADYETLFSMIRAGIQAEIPTQLPMIEGDVNQEVFGNRYLPKQERIELLQWLTDSTFYINAGQLNGLRSGDSFKILAAGKKEPAGEGMVVSAGNFQSIGRTNSRPPKNGSYLLQVDGLHFGSFGTSVFIRNNNAGEEWTKKLSSYLGNYKAVTLTSNADLMLEIQPGANGATSVRLIEKNDSCWYARQYTAGQSMTDKDLEYFLEGIKRSARIRFFRNIQDGGQLAEGVSAKIVSGSPPVNGEILMKPLDVYSLEIENKGSSSLYYTLIDLMPDNEVKVLLPGDFDQPQDYLIRAGEKKTIEGIQVDEVTPAGKEFFKVIFSRTPLDLRSIFKRTKTRGRGDLQSFESTLDDMLADSQEGNRTRSTLSTVKTEEIGIVTTGFTIQKP